MLISTALVMLMVPGLALFYGGMVRRKNVLATMMQSMVALAVVGVFWVAVGYCLAFGDPWLKIGRSLIGWSSEALLPQRRRRRTTCCPDTNIPVYVHCMFQGMFAIITPALISGAIAERIRFGPYCLFIIAVGDARLLPAGPLGLGDGLVATRRRSTPASRADAGRLARARWAPSTSPAARSSTSPPGFSGLAAILVLRKRLGYPEHAMHPNSMVLTLTGAGLLWFGWFGFNGGSGLASGTLAGLGLHRHAGRRRPRPA